MHSKFANLLSPSVAKAANCLLSIHSSLPPDKQNAVLFGVAIWPDQNHVLQPLLVTGQSIWGRAPKGGRLARMSFPLPACPFFQLKITTLMGPQCASIMLDMGLTLRIASYPTKQGATSLPGA